MARLEENAGVLKGFMLRRLGAWLPLPNLATRMHCWPSFQTLTFFTHQLYCFQCSQARNLPYPTLPHSTLTQPYPTLLPRPT